MEIQVFMARLAELPGPVWVLGAYVVSRLGEWAFGLLMQLVSGSWRLGGGTALMFLIPAAGVALPVCVLWGLVGRSPYGLSLALVCRAARWCYAFRCAAHAALFGYDPHLYGGTEMFIRSIARNVVYGALWFLFLLYLERSRALDAAMSGERCDLPRVRCPDGCGVGAGDAGVLPEPLARACAFYSAGDRRRLVSGLRIAHFGPEVSN
ncbi:MAG: hypothetical protein ACLTZY_02845 [Alistipes indistinctus]